MGDLADAQGAVAELLADPAAQAAWQADPGRWARDRLPGDAQAAEMVARLPPWGLWLGATYAEDQIGEPPPPFVGTTVCDEPPGRARSSAPPHPPLVGMGYRRELVPHLWRHLDRVAVFEHTVDNYLHGWPEGRDELARFADQGPVVLHSIHLSVGSERCQEEPDRVDAIGRLCRAAGVDHLSDHLSWTRTGGYEIGDFVPLWRTEAQLDLVCRNVEWLQDRLGIRMAFENASVHFDPGGDLGWAEFSNELVRRTGCGLLLDVTNLLLNEANGMLDATAFLEQLDLDAVLAVHVAGGHERTDLPVPVHVDSHDHPVGAPDLALLTRLLPRLRSCGSVVVERDDRYDHGVELVDDLDGLHRAVEAAQLPVHA